MISKSKKKIGHLFLFKTNEWTFWTNKCWMQNSVHILRLKGITAH